MDGARVATLRCVTLEHHWKQYKHSAEKIRLSSMHVLD